MTNKHIVCQMDQPTRGWMFKQRYYYYYYHSRLLYC